VKLRVTVVIALPDRQEVIDLRLPAGATAGDALAAARVHERYPELGADAPAGIWSRTCSRDTPLREGDRVEVYRTLKADAKAMRRARARVKPASPRSRNAP
jgi:putative ubiquitin-RnfH superfamily antitoxin RatB of RatAB toxin-antitoxin module